MHYDAGQMPVLSDEGKTVRVIAGRKLAEHLQPHVLRRRGAFGGRQRSACRTTNERAIYTVWGDIEISGDVFAPGQKDGKGSSISKPQSIIARACARSFLSGKTC